MKKLRPVALLCAGPVSRSPLTRIPNFLRHLTWVKSSSYRIASRAVNALGAGTPVAEISEMSRAGIWVISVPPPDLPGALRELRQIGIDWRRRVILIFDPEAESFVAETFRSLGASVGTFAPIDTEESRYILEGDLDAIKVARSLIDEGRTRRVIEVKKGTKGNYLAGVQTATKDLVPLIAQAVECFQSAGLSVPESKAIAEALVTGAMRSYFRAGRRAIKS